MIVLDTNVLSELMRPVPDPAVAGWVQAQPGVTLWTTAITLYELRFGLARLPPGRRRQDLSAALDRLLATGVGGGTYDFDRPAAEAAATIAARCHLVGRPIDVQDAPIAGTVAARGATLATRNTRHFLIAGIPLVDPWTAHP